MLSDNYKRIVSWGKHSEFLTMKWACLDTFRNTPVRDGETSARRLWIGATHDLHFSKKWISCISGAYAKWAKRRCCYSWHEWSDRVGNFSHTCCAHGNILPIKDTEFAVKVTVQLLELLWQQQQDGQVNSAPALRHHGGRRRQRHVPWPRGRCLHSAGWWEGQ